MVWLVTLSHDSLAQPHNEDQYYSSIAPSCPLFTLTDYVILDRSDTHSFHAGDASISISLAHISTRKGILFVFLPEIHRIFSPFPLHSPFIYDSSPDSSISISLPFLPKWLGSRHTSAYSFSFSRLCLFTYRILNA